MYYNPTSRTNRVRLWAAFYQITEGEISKFIENINRQAAIVNDIIMSLSQSQSSSSSAQLPPPISEEEKLCVVFQV